MHDAMTDPSVTAALDRLHEAAKGDRWVFSRRACGLWSVLRAARSSTASRPISRTRTSRLRPTRGASSISPRA